MIDTAIANGAIHWETALAVPGGLDLVMDGLTVTDETPAAFEDAYTSYVGRLSLAGASDEQLVGLAQAGMELTRLRSEANGDMQTRFRALLRGIAGELRKVQSHLPAQPNNVTLDDVIVSVRQTLGKVAKDLQKFREQSETRRVGSSRLRRLVVKKAGLQELEQDLLLLKAWMAKEKIFDVEPLVRRILSSDLFLQLASKTVLLRKKMASFLSAQPTI